MKKTIKLTESDLFKIVKKVINEHGGVSAIRKIIAPSSDDLIRAFGDDVARSVESSLSRVLSKQGINIIEKEGSLYIKSLSGNDKLKVGTIKKILDAVSSGKLSIDNVINYFPRYLADGSEFRSTFQNLRPTNPIKKSVSAGESGLLTLDKIPSDEKRRLLNILGTSETKVWLSFGPNPVKMSGWKFHVYGEDLYDSAYLYERLKPVTEKWGAHAKVGVGVDFLPGTVQFGKKGATIYIPPEVIKNNEVQLLLSDIQSAIGGYKKAGTISGDKSITNNITYRYELNEPIPYGEGIPMDQYRKMYTSNTGGDYKPSDVPDLFTGKK